MIKLDVKHPKSLKKEHNYSMKTTTKSGLDVSVDDLAFTSLGLAMVIFINVSLSLLATRWVHYS